MHHLEIYVGKKSIKAILKRPYPFLYNTYNPGSSDQRQKESPGGARSPVTILNIYIYIYIRSLYFSFRRATGKSNTSNMCVRLCLVHFIFLHLREVAADEDERVDGRSGARCYLIRILRLHGILLCRSQNQFAFFLYFP